MYHTKNRTKRLLFYNCFNPVQNAFTWGKQKAKKKFFKRLFLSVSLNKMVFFTDFTRSKPFSRRKMCFKHWWKYLVTILWNKNLSQNMAQFWFLWKTKCKMWKQRMPIVTTKKISTLLHLLHEKKPAMPVFLCM